MDTFPSFPNLMCGRGTREHQHHLLKTNFTTVKFSGLFLDQILFYGQIDFLPNRLLGLFLKRTRISTSLSPCCGWSSTSKWSDYSASLAEHFLSPIEWNRVSFTWLLSGSGTI